MLKQITSDALEGAILQSLSDIPQSPKEIKGSVQVILANDGYDTNLTTASGQDNLYIKVKDKLRAWGKKGVNCIDVGGAKWILADTQTQPKTTLPKTTLPLRGKSKGVFPMTIKIEDIEEIDVIPSDLEEPTEEAQLLEPQPIEEMVIEEPQVIEEMIIEEPQVIETQPKQPKQKSQPKQETQQKECTLMDTITQQKDMWIERLKAEGQAINESPIDLECPSLRALAIATSKCYGNSYKATDDECKICPLAKWCNESQNNKNAPKTQNVQAFVVNPNAEAKAKAEAEAKAKAKAEAKAQQPIVSQKLNDAVSKFGKQEIDLSCDIKCPISSDNLKSGTKGYFVHGIGIVSPRCFA